MTMVLRKTGTIRVMMTQTDRDREISKKQRLEDIPSVTKNESKKVISQRKPTQCLTLRRN